MADRTPFWLGFGKTAWTRRFWKVGAGIEAFKFTIYLIVPITAAVVYTHPEVIKNYIIKESYVKYPKSYYERIESEAAANAKEKQI